MGYEVKQEKILNMIKKLSRNRFLLISYFSTEERKTSYVVVSLDKYGEQVARQRRWNICLSHLLRGLMRCGL